MRHHLTELESTPNAIARETGARLLETTPSVGGVKEATDCFKLFDYNLNLLITSVGGMSR
jgi:hypothetical protein